VTATTTTADQARPYVTPEPTAEALEVAGQLVVRSSLRMRRDVSPEMAGYVLARVLVVHPLGSAHGELLRLAVRRLSKAQSKRGPRPDDQRAARRLIEGGQLPTPIAVAAEARNVRLHREAEAARAERIAPMLKADGSVAAGFVRDYRRRTGNAPTRADLRRYMRHKWRYTDGPALIRRLLEAGWLEETGESGGLRPGPQARGLAW
jgi:hypothetical protein